MKFYTILSNIIIIIIAVCLLILYFLPAKYEISTSVVIEEPAALTFDFINQPEKLKLWFPLKNIEIVDSDNAIDTEIYLIDNQANNSGKMIRRAIYPYDSILYSITFNDNSFYDNDINALSNFKLDEDGNKCTVTWTLSGKLHYFFKWMAFFKEKNFAEKMAKGMQKLKKEVEKIGKVNLAIERTVIPDGQMLLAISDTISKNNVHKIDELENFAYLEIFNYIERNNIESAGPPLTIFYKRNNNSIVDFATPILTKPNLKVKGQIHLIQLYGGPVVKATFTGPENKKKYAYQILDAFMKKNNLHIYKYFWEENINNSPNNYLMNIYYPIKK